MIIMSAHLHHCVLNVKVLVGSFNEVLALVGAFSMIMKTSLMVRLQL